MKIMKINYKRIWLLMALITVGTLVGCDGDEDEMEITPTSNSKVYILNEASDLPISGDVTFTELSDGSIEATIALTGTPDGGMHPAHIHANTAAEGGDIIVSFNDVDGTTGMSTTIITSLDDGAALTYEELLTIDGYVNVHLSADELGTIVAQGDIGQNELTGTTKVYNLDEKDVDGISGTVTFSERINGEALAEIALMNTIADATHPAHIHNNTAAEGGGIAVSFNPVDGTTGMSATNIAALDDGTAITFTEILDFDGYVNVHLGPGDELETIVAQGDIGQNELTGTTKVYNLDEKDVDGISGTVTFSERINGEALAEIALMNTIADATHPAHIHNNSAAEGGGIAVSFKPVDGTTGMSATNIAALDDGTAITYIEILDFDGYVNVHLGSGDQLETIVAQGNIGLNEGVSTGSINYDVTNSGTSAYVFDGNGESASQNPDITLQRGMTYTFAISAAGHPFFIKTAQTTGSADAYSAGVTNNGIESGTITFVVPTDAPDTLFYICEIHGAMTGTITITD